MELFEKAEKYLHETEIEGLIDASDAVLVAYSGGADSSVLLHFLFEYLKNKNVTLAAAHLNHMIRGEEAERDQSFCRKTAEELGIQFFTKNADIPKIASESGKTVEEAARDERYAFLLDISKRLGENTLIATAHNATDNLETVIFNLARGSGTVGMGGISPIRGNIIRPLLSVTSEEIREYAHNRSIPYVTDSTNADTAYTRNYVRKNIVPLIKDLNPSAEEAVLRLGKISRLEADFISEEANKLCLNGYIERNAYISAHPALRSHALRTLYAQKNGSINGLSMTNLDIAADFAYSGRGKISLPNNITLFSDSDRIYLDTDKAEKGGSPKALILADDGVAVPFGKDFAVALCPKGKEPIYDENIYNLFIQQSADFGTIYGRLFVRCRETGDCILTGRMHKKLKKLMCDANIPLRYRNKLPLFCDDHGIIWIPGVSIRDGAKGRDITMYVFTTKG